MRLTKIQGVLKFKHSDWMKKYIDFNTEKKNDANDFAKDFFKLMINSVYGKTMENLRKRIKLMINSLYGKTMESLRKRINVKLVNNEKDFLKYTNRPTYVTHKIFGKDYAAIHEIKPVLILNKPIYVGFTVLDLSK